MVRALVLPLEPEFDELVLAPDVVPPDELPLPEDPVLPVLEDAVTEAVPLVELVPAVEAFFANAGS